MSQAKLYEQIPYTMTSLEPSLLLTIRIYHILSPCQNLNGSQLWEYFANREGKGSEGVHTWYQLQLLGFLVHPTFLQQLGSHWLRCHSQSKPRLCPDVSLSPSQSPMLLPSSPNQHHTLPNPHPSRYPLGIWSRMADHRWPLMLPRHCRARLHCLAAGHEQGQHMGLTIWTYRNECLESSNKMEFFPSTNLIASSF